MENGKTVEEFLGSLEDFLETKRNEAATAEEEIISFVESLPSSFNFTEAYNYISAALESLIVREIEYKFGGEQPYSPEAIARFQSLLMALRRYWREKSMSQKIEGPNDEKKTE